MIKLFSGKQLLTNFAKSIAAIALMASAGGAIAQGVNTITKTVVAGANAKVGEEITYQLAIGCNSDPGNCGSLTLVDNISSDLEFSSSTALATGFSCTGACAAGQSGTITLSKPAFNGGDTLTVELKLRVKPGTPTGTVIGNAIQSTISTPSAANLGPTKTSPTVNMTTGANNPQWSTNKVKTDPLGAIQPGLGQDVSYKVTFCSATLVGNEDLTNLSLVDTFPAGATVINADGGTVGANTITWNLASFSPGILLANLYAGGGSGQKCLEKNVTVNYPAGAFPLGTNVVNNITYTAGTAGTPGPICLNTVPSQCFTNVTNTISTAQSTPAPSKFAPHIVPGSTLNYSIGIDVTAANAPVQQLEIIDTFPTNANSPGNSSGLVLTGLTVSSGAWSTLNVTADIAFSTTAGCGAATFNISPSTQVSGAAAVALAVPAGALCVRWQFHKTGDTFAADSGIPKTFAFSTQPTVTIPTLATPPHVYAPALPSTATNCIAAKTSTSAVVPACASPNIELATPAISSQKSLSVGDANNLVPFSEDLNNLYTTRLRFVHIANDSTGPVVNPVVADLLPAAYEFVGWSAYTGPSPAPNLEVIPNYGGSGRTMVRYTWNAVVPSGATTFPSGAGVSNAISIPNTTPDANMPTMDFQFKIKPGTVASSFSNDMTTFDNGPRKTCDNETDEAAAGIDFNGNGTMLASEKFCKGSLAVTVISSASLEGKKYIKSSDVGTFPNLQDPTSVPAATVCPDVPAASNFTRFPCVARGLPGSAFDYRIDIVNSGNEPLNNYVMYDVLPHPGDLGVTEPIAAVARGSQFRVTLTGPVTIDTAASSANAGSLGAAIFEYNPADGNSCRPEVSASATESPAAHWQPGCNNTWVTNPLADGVNFPLGFASVKSFRIKVAFGTPFAPTQKFVINVPMLIPTSAPPTRIAWNTFGHRASNSNTASRLPTAAPRRVGIFVPERYRVGNLVWLDSNRNGLAEAGEPALAGVDVKLVRDNGGTPNVLDATDTVIATTTTDVNGKYLFEGLPAGNYFVVIPTTQVTTPAVLNNLLPSAFGKELTPNSDGDNNQNGTNAVLIAASPVAGLASGLITLGAASEPITEVDRVGGADDDPGAPVNTFDALQINSNVDKYPDNLSNLSVDFGFHRPFSLGNRVWLDVNNNGILDGGEAGIGSVVVNLLDSAGNPVDGNPDTVGVQAITTTTDVNGHYRFDNLPAGDYIVEIIAPAGLTSSTGVNGAVTGPYEGAATPDADAFASDIDDNGSVFNAATGSIRSKPVTLDSITVPAEPTSETDVGVLGAGPHPDLQNNLTVDFGLFRPFSLGNRVWLDTPAGGGTANNAIMDGAETGPAGVVLKLKDALGVDIDGDPVTPGIQIVTVTTTAGGYYRFDNLLAGSYIVEVVAANFTAGQPLDGLWTTTGAGQEDNPNLDIDKNDNGIDVGVVGAIQSGVIILGTATAPAEPLAAVETDLGPGQGPFAGFPDAQSNLTVDFGFTTQPPGYSLGNRVWFDTNNNGIVDGAEAGIVGVAVEVWTTDALGVPTGALPLATQTTIAGGYYLFKTLPAGTYKVVIAASNFASGGVLAGFYSSGTTQAAGGITTELAASTDVTAAGTNNDHGTKLLAAAGAVPVGAVISNIYTLGPGNNQPTGEDGNTTPGIVDGMSDDRSNLTADFGFYTMSVGNFIFNDDGSGVGGVMNDGVRNGSEPAFPNIGVSIFNDQNGDGAPDGAAIASTLTDAAGNYLFVGLPAGKYVIEAAKPTGYASSTPTTAPSNSVTDDNKDHGSAVSPLAVRTSTITLTPGAAPLGEVAGGATTPVKVGGGTPSPTVVPDANVNSTIDFGFVRVYSVGNRVFLDPNNDGVKDASELPLPNVLVRLLDASLNVIATQTTDSQGYYRFDDLVTATYTVEVVGATLEAGSTSSTGTVLGDSGDKGLDTPVAGNFRSAPFVLSGNSFNEPDHSGAGQGAQGPGGDVATNSTIDFGFVPPKYSIGNRVWRDSNNDGQRQAAEPGIAGVVVNLFAADATGNPVGAAITSTTTDGSGYYRFDNLNKGDYVVVIDKSNFQTAAVLRPFLSSTPTQVNPNTDIDNDDNGIDAQNPETTGVKSGKITVGPGQPEPVGETDLGAGGQGPLPDPQANMTVDFGFYPLSSLGDRVWLDTNGNGIQDAGEAGIPGVSVKLLDGLGNPFLDRNGVAVATTTDSNGNYLFKDLPVGNYQVKFMPPAGYVISPKDQGTDDAVDSDADPVTMLSSVITLGPDQTNLTLDAGLFFNAGLGDRVWHDLNKNGIQDAGEPGVPNVTVNLLDALTNAVVATTTTDASGNYNFAMLVPGRAYVVEFTNLPATYQFTTKGPGVSTSDAGDSDANVTTGRTDPITLASGQNDPNWDAGIYGQIDLALSKSVAPVAPATGSPYNTGDTVEYTVTVVNNGPATALAGYTVKDTVPVGVSSLVVTASTGFSGCAFAGQTLNCTGTADLAAGTPNALTIKYKGVIAATSGSLKNVAYVDKSPTDPSAESIPLGTPPTSATNTATSSTNNDADATIVVNAATFSLGNRVWIDTNNDGIQNNGEVGRDGVIVELLNPTSGAVIATTITAAGGFYRFDNLPAGDYIVQIAAANFALAGALPSFKSSTGAGQESNPNSDGDRNDNGLDTPVAGAIRSGVVTLGPTTNEPVGETEVVSPAVPGEAPDNRSNLTVDFGFVPTFNLGNRVWSDTNGNGLRDTGEPGIAGASVKLIDSTGAVIATTSTDGNGYYRFDNLPAGTYVVEVATPPGTTPTLVPATGGAPDNNVDNDNNGVNPVAGGVRSGTVTLGPVGAEPSNESDIAPTGQGGADSNANMTVDFGFTPSSTYSLGNRVWNDTNGNGLRDATEPGISGATVKLLDATGTTVATTTTDANGYYRFDNLPAGSYAIEVATPAGLTPTLVPASGATPDNNIDNDNNGANPVAGGVRSGTVTLGPVATEPVGETDLAPSGQGAADNNANMTVDVGFTPILSTNYSIGNRVWLDTNANGIRDGAEPGIAGLTVRLLSGDGATVIATTSTDGGGYYRFDNVPAGNYQVEVVMPAGYTPTIVPATGANPNNDVDSDNNGVATVNGALRANAVTVGPGISEPTGETDLSGSGQGGADANGNMTVDFGLRTTLTASLGDFVWSDTNKDGIQDAGEPGLAGVKVYLFQNGVVIASTVTDANGKYAFTNLTPGVEYVVGADKLPGYTFSPPGAGPNRATDSNANVTTGWSSPVVLAPGENNPTIDFGMFPPAAGQPIQLVKTLFEGSSNGAGCAAAKTKLIVVDKTGTGIDVTYCFKVTNPGPAHMTNVKITDNKLDLGTNAQVLSIGTLTQVAGSGTLPLAPGASITFFRTTKIIGSLTNVATVEGTPSNAAGVPTGALPSTASSGSAILASIIDPPSVRKIGTLVGANLVEWRMVWINSSDVFAQNVTIVDPIPVDNGFAGTLTCTAKGTSITKSCDFIAPTAANPRGSVVWNGSIGVDNGRSTEATALNAVVISFRATVTPGVASVSNQATSSWDYDGDGVPELTNVLSDDPSAGGAADPTRLQLIGTNQQVPTLSEWALMLLIMLMAGFAYRELKRSGRLNER